jgi:membrane protein DedA with SNARE-associated domain
MHHIVQLIQSFASTLGGPGLALVAFIDSSSVPLPDVADTLVIVGVVAHRHLWWYYPALATAGSVAGCQLIYELARRGGERFLEKRLRKDKVEKALRRVRRHGLLAIIVPAILPPPMPFKIFVLLAGAAGIGPGTFAAAVTAGRAFRFFGEAVLARAYGNAALQAIQNNIAQASLWFAGCVALGAMAWQVWHIRRRRRARQAAGQRQGD